MTFIFIHYELKRGCGGIGRHDGLKIRYLVIVCEGSSPSVPINFQKIVSFK